MSAITASQRKDLSDGFYLYKNIYLIGLRSKAWDGRPRGEVGQLAKIKGSFSVRPSVRPQASDPANTTLSKKKLIRQRSDIDALNNV